MGLYIQALYHLTLLTKPFKAPFLTTLDHFNGVQISHQFRDCLSSLRYLFESDVQPLLCHEPSTLTPPLRFVIGQF